jgi:ATP-dependent DNA ligase
MPLAFVPPKTSPFGTPLDLAEVHWVKPMLVCEVRFLLWTSGGMLRQVNFQALRGDKPAEEVVYDPPAAEEPESEAVAEPTVPVAHNGVPRFSIMRELPNAVVLARGG